MPSSGRDFYAILGVPRDVDDDALKKAYKRAAIKWHPDRHVKKAEAEKKAAEEKFKEVAEAFEILSDKNKRAIYDQYGEDGLRQDGSGMPPGAGGFPGGGAGGFGARGFPGGVHFSFSSSGMGGGGGMDAARAQQMFAQFFGGGGLGGMMGDDDDPFASLLGGGGMMGGGMMGGMPGMVGGRRRRRRSRPDQLAQGTLVTIVGLKEGGQHNGSVARVAEFDEERSRYVVSLEGGDGQSLAVRPQNLRQVVQKARVVGIKDQEGLNGRVVSAATYDKTTKRYRCEGLKGDRSVLALKPENVMLPNECRVTIDGVQSRPALNGRVGSVVGVEADRYVVQLPEEKLSMRFGAVAAC